MESSLEGVELSMGLKKRPKSGLLPPAEVAKAKEPETGQAYEVRVAAL